MAKSDSRKSTRGKTAGTTKRKRRRAGSFRLALTGTRTFLGEALIAAMEADPRCEHIVALDVRMPRRAGPKTRFVRVDLTNPSADEKMAHILREDGVDVLCHLAFLAFPSHARSWAHELEAIGTYFVMNAAAEALVSKVVLGSTTMVYGAHPTNPNFIHESAPLRGTPASRWVRDKVNAERELARLKKDCPTITTTSLRYCTILGPRIRSFHAQVMAKQRLPSFMGYDPLMQFLHEEDAVAALVRAVKEDHEGAFNIVGEGVLPFSRVRRMGSRTTLSMPHVLAYPLTSVLWNLQLVDVAPSFMNFYRYPWVADDTRMREVMGFTPRHTSQETLRCYFNWLRASERDMSARDEEAVA